MLLDSRHTLGLPATMAYLRRRSKTYSFTLICMLVVGSAVASMGCIDADELKRSRRALSTPLELPQDAGPLVDASSVVGDSKVTVDGRVGCTMEASCTTNDDCAPTENCFQRNGVANYCAPSCQPDPAKGGDCAGRLGPLLNALDGYQTETCMENTGCVDSLDTGSACAPGIQCYTNTFLQSLCRLPGLAKLDEPCDFTFDALDGACEFPLMCIPIGIEGAPGRCRQPCDSYAGGPGTTRCRPGWECTLLERFAPIKWAYCCTPGTGCGCLTPDC